MKNIVCLIAFLFSGMENASIFYLDSNAENPWNETNN